MKRGFKKVVFRVKRGTFIQIGTKIIQLKQGETYDIIEFGQFQGILEKIVLRNTENFEVIKEEKEVKEETIEEPVVEEPKKDEELQPVEEESVSTEQKVEEEVDLNRMSKEELIEYQTSLGLEVDSSMKKSEIKRMIKEMR